MMPFFIWLKTPVHSVYSFNRHTVYHPTKFKLFWWRNYFFNEIMLEATKCIAITGIKDNWEPLFSV